MQEFLRQRNPYLQENQKKVEEPSKEGGKLVEYDPLNFNYSTHEEIKKKLKI